MRPSQTKGAALVPLPFTSYPGVEVSPSFSPDGNHVAFAWWDESRRNFDIANVIAAKLAIHQAGHGLIRHRISVIGKALHERRGAITDPDNADANGIACRCVHVAVHRSVDRAHRSEVASKTLRIVERRRTTFVPAFATISAAGRKKKNLMMMKMKTMKTTVTTRVLHKQLAAAASLALREPRTAPR